MLVRAAERVKAARAAVWAEGDGKADSVNAHLEQPLARRLVAIMREEERTQVISE